MQSVEPVEQAAVIDLRGLRMRYGPVDVVLAPPVLSRMARGVSGASVAEGRQKSAQRVG